MEESYCSDCKIVTAVISDHSTGDTICLNCGLVLEAYLIDETSEWRTFADEPANNDPHRVGDKSNPLLSNNGLTTLISMPNKGGECQYTSSNSFRRFNQANMKDPDKGLIEAFKAIEAMSDRLGLVSTVKDLANEIYKKMEEVKSSKGRNKKAMFAACLFVACKRLEKPRTMKEIESVGNGVTRKEIGRANSDISKHLEEIGNGDTEGTTHTTDAGDFVRRFCSLLGMGHKAVKAAQEAVAKTEECDIRRTPVTVAASIIYMITLLSDERKQIRDVADATRVAQGTIKKCYEEIYPFASRLVPAWYANEEDLKRLYRP